MEHNKLMVATIFDDEIVSIERENNGLKSEKITDFKGFVNFFSTYSSSESPLLPKNIIKYGIKNGRVKVLLDLPERFYTQGFSLRKDTIASYADCDEKTLDSILLEERGQKHSHRDHDEDDDEEDDEDYDDYGVTFKAYLPKALLYVELFIQDEHLEIANESTRLFYYFDSILMPTTELYLFPCGNIYDGSWKMCWGGIQFPNYNTKDLRGIASLYDMWLSGNSNDDLGFKFDEGRLGHLIATYEIARKYATLEELKSNSEDYLAVCNELSGHMKTAGKTFSTFMSETI